MTKKSSAQPRGQVSLKGKSMSAISNLANDLVFGMTYPKLPRSTRDPVLDLICSLHKACINRDDARSFLLCELFLFVREANDGGQREPTAEEQPQLREQFASRLKARIEALPDKYVVRLELPSFPELPASEIRLADGVRLVLQPNAAKQEKRQANALLALALMGKSAKPEAPPVAAYFELDVEGFCDGSSDSSAVARCTSTAKQCAFLMVQSQAAANGWDRKTAAAQFSPSP